MLLLESSEFFPCRLQLSLSNGKLGRDIVNTGCDCFRFGGAVSEALIGVTGGAQRAMVLNETYSATLSVQSDEGACPRGEFRTPIRLIDRPQGLQPFLRRTPCC